MSWFDSSFSLAKQALSKAQKSIDRALDIQEGAGENGPVNLPSGSAGTSPPKESTPVPAATKATGSGSRETTSNSASRPSSTQPREGATTNDSPRGKSRGSEEATSFSPSSSRLSSSLSSSTWATGDSYWNSYFSSGGKGTAKKQPTGSPSSAGNGKGVSSTTKQRKLSPPLGGSTAEKTPATAAPRPNSASPLSSPTSSQTLSTPVLANERAKKGASPMVLTSPNLTSTPLSSHQKRNCTAGDKTESREEEGEMSGKQVVKMSTSGITREVENSSLQQTGDKELLPVKGSSGDEVDSESTSAVAVLDDSTHQQAAQWDTPTTPQQAIATSKGISEMASGSLNCPTKTVGHVETLEAPRSLAYITYASPTVGSLPEGRDGRMGGVVSAGHVTPPVSQGMNLVKETEDVDTSVVWVEGGGRGSDAGSRPPSGGKGGERHNETTPEGERLQEPSDLVSEQGAVMAADNSERDGMHSPEQDIGGVVGQEEPVDEQLEHPSPPSSSSSRRSLSPAHPATKDGIETTPSPREPLQQLPRSPVPSSSVVTPNSISATSPPLSPISGPGSACEEAPLHLDRRDKHRNEELETIDSKPHSQLEEDSESSPTISPTCLDNVSPVASPGPQPLQSSQRERPQRSAPLEGGEWPPESGACDPETATVSPPGPRPPSQGSEAEALQEELEKLKKEFGRVSQLLDVRESKMLEMSKETIELMEANQTIHRQLSNAHESLQAGQSDSEDLRSEFTRRLGMTEKKLQTVVKERDSLRKQLQAVQSEQTHLKRTAEQELSELLREKEEQIAGLMEEGEKLSKQQLTSSNAIKKLRQKSKENDQLLAAQRQQIEDCETDISRLKDVIKKREDNERKYQESLVQLNTIAEQQTKELTVLKRERDDLSDNVRSLQANLDSSYRELAELQKANAMNQNAAQEAALGAERGAREELMHVLEQQRLEAQQDKDTLLIQLNELRTSLSRTEQQAAWREDHLRQEVADMQQRLQEAEGRNQDLSSTIAQATKPLLRQIDNLQTAHSTQAANWERVEANLTQRLVDVQTQLATSTENERSAVEKELTLQSRVSILEAQLSSLRQEKSQLLASLELERAKLETLEEGQQRESARMEALRSSYQQSMEDLRKEKEMLERQLEYERVRLEAESRKACLESQEKERLRSQLANSLSSLNRSVSRQSSTTSTHSQSEVLERSLVSGDWDMKSIPEGGGDGGPIFPRVPSASASVIEHFQSLVKQKEGELVNSRSLVDSLERSRAAVAQDLATVSAEKETLGQEVQCIAPLRERVQEVERKYEALLQMYGEKAEEAEELKLDIQDLKAMYRQQIDQLLSGMR